MTGVDGRAPAVLVLGTADWNQAIATNQHYATRALAEEFAVTFVESMGLRRVEFSRRDLARILRRLSSKVSRRATGGTVARSRPDGMTVLTPLVVPLHSVAVARWFNERSLRRLVAQWLEHDGPRLLWTYSPETYGLEAAADAVIYHCVDLLHEVAGISSDVVLAGERQLARLGALAAGTGGVVRDHLRAVGFEDPLTWPNVADVDVFDWRRPRVDSDARLGRAVFAGNLSTSKVDFELLCMLAEAGVDLHLAGPVAEGGGRAQAELDRVVSAGATYHGILQADSLADLCVTASVGLIPYVDNAYTRGVSPLKTYEYLASGLRVVSTPIPAVNPIGNDVVVCGSHEEFVVAVAETGLATEQDRVRRVLVAEQHSWAERGVVIRSTARQALGIVEANS